MKKNFLISSLMVTVSFINSYATVRTVSNHISGGSQYSSFEAAYAASASGDTLIVEGTGTAYFFASGFSKSLVVIGAGFNSDKQLFQKTIILGESGGNDVALNAGADNSKFYGICFGGIGLLKVNNVVFEDCQFIGHFTFIDFFDQPSSNIVFRNCIFDEDNVESLILPVSAPVSVILSNCILDNYLNGKNNSNIDLTIDHCVFLKNINTKYTLTDVKNALVSNSIFMNSNRTFNSGTTGCTFLNNLERVAATLPAADGNIGNTDPMFLSYTLGSLYSPNHDYDLQPGSAAELAGSDGTDIGVHGGTSGFSESGEVLITPIVREVDINNLTVSPNGTLNVHIKATKPNDQ